MLPFANALMMGGAAAALRVQDVFAATAFTISNADQTVTTGVDLLNRGGLSIFKDRSAGFTSWWWKDTSRGDDVSLNSNATGAQGSGEAALFDFLSTGVRYPSGATQFSGTNGDSGVHYSLAEAPGFFDVVTYAGDGADPRIITHSLGVVPGLILIKRYDGGTTNWNAFFRQSDGSYANLRLNTTAATAGDISAANAAAKITATGIDIGWINTNVVSNVNTSAQSNVAYLFAHDASAGGLIQCFSFTTDGSGAGTFNTGWANGAQLVDLKCSSTTGDWERYDTTRTSGFTGSDARLLLNSSAVEDSQSRISQSAGVLTFAGLSASQTYVGMVIRAP